MRPIPRSIEEAGYLLWILKQRGGQETRLWKVMECEGKRLEEWWMGRRLQLELEIVNEIHVRKTRRVLEQNDIQPYQARYRPCTGLLGRERRLVVQKVPLAEEYEEHSSSQASVSRLYALEWGVSTQTKRSSRETRAPAFVNSNLTVSFPQLA